MENENFRLVVRRGPRPNEVYDLASDVVNLGRDITNDIVINDREVSRHHLRFTKGADGITLEDLGSTNGTFVNGKRITGSIALKNGDMIGLGETVTLQYETGQPGANVGSPQPPQAVAPPSDQDAQYRPPAQQAPSQPSPPPQQTVPQANPYNPPKPEPQVQADPAPQYQEADAYAPPQNYYDEQGAAAYGPPPPGYDYDPYAMREDEPNNTMQWLMIGCTGLLLLCCCLTVVAAVAIDSFCLYDSVPILNNILDALAIPVNCPS